MRQGTPNYDSHGIRYAHSPNVVMRPIIRFVRVCSQRISGSFASLPPLHIISDLYTASVPIEEAKAPFQCRRAKITQIKRRMIASRVTATYLRTRLVMDKVLDFALLDGSGKALIDYLGFAQNCKLSLIIGVGASTW